jgi:hypothetical protein
MASPDSPDTASPLAHDPIWRPRPEEETRLLADAGPDAPVPFRQEARWWQALRAGARRDWAEVSGLAEAGLAEPFSEREAARLAFLHCLSGNLEEAEHVVAQAVQLHGDDTLPRRLAGWLAREGLGAAADRFGGPARR